METENGNVQENRYNVENLHFELLENGKRTGFVYHNGGLLHEEGGDEQESNWQLSTALIYCFDRRVKAYTFTEGRLEMKKLFNAIRKNDLETIKRVLDANPELINCVATPPPKKDEGQSLLQVANKAGSLEIAHYLIDRGIDVNYQEPDNGLPYTQCYTCPVLIDAVRFLLKGGPNWKERVQERKKLIIHLLEKGADPNETDNRSTNAWDWAINTYCDERGTVGDTEQQEMFAALEVELLEMLYQSGANILNIDRVQNELKRYENYSLFLQNLILNREDLYGVAPEMLEIWKKRWLPVIPLVKPFYKRNNSNYEN